MVVSLRGRASVAGALSLVAGSILAAPAAAAVEYTTVALSGQPAPGTGAGINYAPGFGSPTLSDSGQVGYTAILTGTGVTGSTNRALYAGNSTSPQLVARAGNAAPGTSAGVTYSVNIGTPVLNDAGQVAYSASLTGSGVTTANSDALFAGTFAAPQLVAREGSAAPGAAAGVNYSLFFDPTLSDDGQVAYLAHLTGTGVTSANFVAMYAGNIASPQQVARADDAAPGTPAGVTYLSFGIPVLNDAAQLAYIVSLAGSGVSSTNDSAIYAGSFASPQLIAREGNAAPGTTAGVNYLTLGVPTLNDTGQIAFTTRLTGTGVTGANDAALYAGTLVSPQLVARSGDAAPGTGAGVNYFIPGAPALNDVGQVAYFAALAGSVTPGVDDEAVYAGNFASPQLIARRGDAAPGAAAGVNFSDFAFGPSLNDAGQVAYMAILSGSGVSSANDLGLYAYDPTLGDLLIAREGDLFDVGGGDLRTISGGNGISFLFGRNDDARTLLSNNGLLVFELTFTDGSNGIFTAAVPEPTAVSVLAIAAVALRRRRS